MQTRYQHKNKYSPTGETADTGPRTLDSMLQRQQLAFIVNKAKKLMRLQQHLYKCLPNELRPHCQVMNLIGPSLIIQVDNGAIASRLRFMAPDILEEMKQNINHERKTTSEIMINSIRIKTRPMTTKTASLSSPPPQKTGKQTSFEDESTEQTENYANTISHPRLSELWQRLLRRSKIREK